MNTPIAANADPATSHESAQWMDDSGTREKQCNIVFASLRRHNGSTSSELASWELLDRHMVARRLPDLRSSGRVKNGPSRKCQESGRNAITWFIVEKQTEMF